MQASELQKGWVVRPAGSAKHVRWRTVDVVSPDFSEPSWTLIFFKGEGGRARRVKATAEFELQPKSLPVLKSERTTIDRYDLRQAEEVTVLRGRGQETVTTNCIRVTCVRGRATAEVWGTKPGGTSGWLKLTDREETRILEGLGVKC